MDYVIPEEYVDLSKGLGTALISQAPIEALLTESPEANTARQTTALRRLCEDGWASLFSQSRCSDPRELTGSIHVASELGRTPTVGLAPLLLGFLAPLLGSLGVDESEQLEVFTRGTGVTTVVPRDDPAHMIAIAESGTGKLIVNRPRHQVVILAPEQAEFVLLPIVLDQRDVRLAMVPLSKIHTALTWIDSPDLTCQLGKLNRRCRIAGDILLEHRVTADNALLALRRAQEIYYLVLSAQAVGGGAEVIRRTVLHLESRRQFGMQLAGFQVLRHRVADMWLLLENSRALLFEAAWRLAEQSAQAGNWIHAVRIYSANAYRAICSSAIQCHGGMGFTWESGLHLWYRNALTSGLVLTDLEYCREQIWENDAWPMTVSDGST